MANCLFPYLNSLEFAVDKLQRLASIDGNILLMVGGVVSIAAEGILRITVDLDFVGVGAREASRSCIKLESSVSLAIC
jgi:hypothetical protein